MNRLVRLLPFPLAFVGLLQAGEPAPDLSKSPVEEQPVDLSKVPVGDSTKEALAVPLSPPPPRWSLTAGPIFRRIGEIDFDSGVSRDTIPDLFGEDSFTAPPGIGSGEGYDDRAYADGFVNIGAGTAATGLTTYWGYRNASQLEGGSTLLFNQGGGERRDVTTSGGRERDGWEEDEDWEAGPYLALTYDLVQRPGLRAGVGINFSSINLDGSQRGLTTLSSFQQLDVYDVRVEDRYALGGVIIPDAPYAGSEAGPGPLIPNGPTDRRFPEDLASTETAFFADQVREEFDLDLHTFGIGGHVHWIPRGQFFLEGQAGIAFNIADWKASREEVILRSENGGAAGRSSRRAQREDDTELLWGLYVQAAAGWQINETWSLQGFARYDWNEDLDGSVGPSRFDVDLSGWSLGAGATISF